MASTVLDYRAGCRRSAGILDAPCDLPLRIAQLEQVTTHAYGPARHRDLQPIEYIGTPSNRSEVWRFGDSCQECGRILVLDGWCYVLVRAGRDSARFRVLAGRWVRRSDAYRALVW